MTEKKAPPATAKRRFPAREAAKQETREALVQAATDLFKESGLDAPSLDAVCARAGYTRGAFYVHFKDRDELIAAVMDQVGHNVIDRLLGPRHGDRPESVQAIMQRFLGALTAGEYPLSRAGGVRPHQLMDACARSSKIRARYVELVEDSIRRLAGTVNESQRRGSMRQDIEPDQIAQLLLFVVIGVHTLYDLEVPMDLGGGAASLFKLLERINLSK